MDASSRDRMCAVAPSPELRDRLKDAVRSARAASGLPVDGPGSLLREPRRLGFNDGVLRPDEGGTVVELLLVARRP